MNIIKSQKVFTLLTILIVCWLSWQTASQASFISDNEWRIKFALLSAGYVGLISFVGGVLLGGMVWLVARRNLFVMLFAIFVIILFNSRELGPLHVLPKALVKLNMVYYTLPLEYVDDLQAGPEYNFRKVRWGMSMEQVKSSETVEPNAEGPPPSNDYFEAIIYENLNCLGFKGDLYYLFEGGILVGANYELHAKQDYELFYKKLEEVYGGYAFKYKIDNTQRYFWDVGGSEIYLDLPASSKSKQKPGLHFISKQYSTFFNFQ